MKLSNCLFFAVLGAIKNGQYVVVRKSRQQHNWPFCKYHFLVVPPEVVDKCAKSFVPDKDNLGPWPCPLFNGHIKHGDK